MKKQLLLLTLLLSTVISAFAVEDIQSVINIIVNEE